MRLVRCVDPFTIEFVLCNSTQCDTQAFAYWKCSLRVLTCSLQCFCIDAVLLPFELTRSNDVSLKFPVIQVNKNENIGKVVVETAGHGWLMYSRTKRSGLLCPYIEATSTGTMHDAIPAMENRESSMSHLLLINIV